MVFGRTVKLLPHYHAVSEAFICHPTSPTAMVSQFPNCLEVLIYLAEEGGPGPKFWERGFNKRP